MQVTFHLLKCFQRSTLGCHANKKNAAHAHYCLQPQNKMCWSRNSRKQISRTYKLRETVCWCIKAHCVVLLVHIVLVLFAGNIYNILLQRITTYTWKMSTISLGWLLLFSALARVDSVDHHSAFSSTVRMPAAAPKWRAAERPTPTMTHKLLHLPG